MLKSRSANAVALEYPCLICSSRYTAKPQIAIAMLRVPGVSVGSARLDEVAAAGAAAHHAPAGVAIVFVRGPLPDVAGHVVDTVRAGSLRVAATLLGRPGFLPAQGPSFSKLPQLARPQSSSLPQGYSRPSVPRAAFSHSSSLGRRPPAKAQKACASCQFTLVTGSSGSWARSMAGCGQRRAATQRAYMARVTSVRSMRYAGRERLAIGRSSSAPRLEPFTNDRRESARARIWPRQQPTEPKAT